MQLRRKGGYDRHEISGSNWDENGPISAVMQSRVGKKLTGNMLIICRWIGRRKIGNSLQAPVVFKSAFSWVVRKETVADQLDHQ